MGKFPMEVNRVNTVFFRGLRSLPLLGREISLVPFFHPIPFRQGTRPVRRGRQTKVDQATICHPPKGSFIASERKNRPQPRVRRRQSIGFQVEPSFWSSDFSFFVAPMKQDRDGGIADGDLLCFGVGVTCSGDLILSRRNLDKHPRAICHKIQQHFPVRV